MNGNEWKMEGNDWQKTGVNSTNKQMAHFGSPQGTIYIYIYSDPIGDRIFLQGMEFMLELCWMLAKEKNSSWNIGRPAGKVKNRQLEYGFGGIDKILMFKVAHSLQGDKKNGNGKKQTEMKGKWKEMKGQWKEMKGK